MPRCWTKTLLTALVCLLPAMSAAQGRTAGQIVGTVKDASGAVVPKADLVLIDNGTGATTETKSGADGGFVFPNLQPGRYQITRPRSRGSTPPPSRKSWSRPRARSTSSSSSRSPA